MLSIPPDHITGSQEGGPPVPDPLRYHGQHADPTRVTARPEAIHKPVVLVVISDDPPADQTPDDGPADPEQDVAADPEQAGERGEKEQLVEDEARVGQSSLILGSFRRDPRRRQAL